MKPTTPTRPAPPACIACGQRDWKPRYEILLECESCGYTRAAIDVDESALENLYGEGYFQGEVYADYLAERAVFRKNFTRRLEVMREAAGRLASVFEIGCAYGLWLEFASAHGIECAGIDLCPEAAAYARRSLGQNAVSGDFVNLDLERGSYEAFVMWDTIEHLAHPELFVGRMVELLPSGGWLFFTTGDIGSRLARRQGARWRMIQPPVHLHYFSRATVSRFLERHGLKVHVLQSEPVYRNLRGTLANLAILGRGTVKKLAGSAAAVLPEFVQEKTAFWVDLGDVMFVGARKP